MAENPGADMYYLSHEDRKKFRAYMEQQMRWVEDAEAYGLDLLSIIKKLRYGGQMTKGEWACYFEAERFFDGFKRDFHAEFEKLWDELEMGVY